MKTDLFSINELDAAVQTFLNSGWKGVEEKHPPIWWFIDYVNKHGINKQDEYACLGNSIRSYISSKASHKSGNRKPRSRKNNIAKQTELKLKPSNGSKPQNSSNDDSRAISVRMDALLEKLGYIPEDVAISELTSRTLDCVVKARKSLQQKWTLIPESYGWSGTKKPQPTPEEITDAKEAKSRLAQFEAKYGDVL